MFEEICLVCGKHLDDDARAYCSEDCQSQDTSSPSISSASSAVSSPNLGYATGGDVPALVPSALGSALSKYTHGRHHYSVSSSSASSTSWSVVTDDEDDAPLGVGSYRINHFHESEDSLYEGSSKSANFLDSMKPSPSALSYARRPSGTNNRSTVPNPHGRTTSAHVPEVPRSAPLHSHLSTDDDAGYSDVGFSSRDESESEFHVTKPVSPPRSKRNRTSLPAYFSLLQMSNLTGGKRISPVSSSSGNTIARRSPPTPKIPLAGLTHSSSTIPSVASHTTPRGRRRVQGGSRGSRCSGDSSSRSPSRSRRALPQFSQGYFYSQESPPDDEGFTDWASAPGLSRGRAPVRRNSSPPPKMMLSTVALEDHNRALAAASRTEGALSSGLRKTRGRAKAEVDVDAPGYGHGRSGLLDRERVPGIRPGRVL